MNGRRLRALGYGLGRGARAFVSNRWLGGAAVAVICIAFAFLALTAVFADYVDRLARDVGRDANIVLYLDPEVDRERASILATALRDNSAIERVEVIDRQRAMVRLERAIDRDGEWLSDVDSGLLPTTIELSLADDIEYAGGSSLLVSRLERLPEVDAVDLLGDWTARTRQLATRAKWAARIVLLAVSLACVFIVLITVRLGLPAKTRERDIYRMLGASTTFVRGPAIFEGIAMGTLGASLAVAGTYALIRTGRHAFAGAIPTTWAPLDIDYLSPTHTALLIIAGSVMGAIGSWLAVHHDDD